MKKRLEMKKQGFAVPLTIPTCLKLPFKKEPTGYMLTYTRDYVVALKIQAQLKHLCDVIKISANSKLDAGCALCLELDIVNLFSANDVSCIDALARIYRDMTF